MMPFARRKTIATLPLIDANWTVERASDGFGEPHVSQAGDRTQSRSEMQAVSLDLASYGFKRHAQSEALTQAFRCGNARIIVPIGARLALNRAKASFSYRMTLTLSCLPARAHEPLCLWRANRDGAIMRSAHGERIEVNSLYEECVELPRFRDLTAAVTHISLTTIYLVTTSADGSCLVAPTRVMSPLFEIDRSDSQPPPASGLRQSAITIKG